MSSPTSSRKGRRSSKGSKTPTPSKASSTPRRTAPGSANPTSSPLFFQSSPANRAGSQRSPLGPSNLNISSPVRETNIADGDSTPRAGRAGQGESSPIRYMSSSSPPRNIQHPQTDALASSDGMFFRSDRSADSTGLARMAHRRGDIHSDTFSGSARRRRIFVGEDGMPVASTGSEATFSNINPDTDEANILGGDSTRVIWGTNIAIQDSMSAFRKFLYNYTRKYRLWHDGATEAETNTMGPFAEEKEYLMKLEEMRKLGVTGLNMDMKNLKVYPPTLKLWHQLQAYPQEIIPLMDQTIKDVLIDLATIEKRAANRAVVNRAAQLRSSVAPLSSETGGTPRPTPTSDVLDPVDEVEAQIYKILPFGLDKTINMRDLDPADMDTMVSIKGLVIRATPVIPDMKDAFFQCSVCNHSVLVSIDRGKIAEPSECPREACKSKDSMQIQHNRCEFADKQIIKLQETPDSVPDGQTPHSVSLCAYDDLVDVCKAGDRVEVTGVFRSNPVRVNPRQRVIKSLFKTYVDVLHIQKVDKRKVGIDVSTVEQELSEQATGSAVQARKVSAEEEAKIKETAQREDIYELLSRSLAPSIYEMDDVKKGILLQLFGGTNKSFEKGGSPKYRGDINVLLCGDPSTSKSQLLQYVHKIAPRGVYTSGKGSSAVGLTAYVTRDPESRQLVLESGALVLSDGGVCCIDEFDKMSDSTRSVLHEVMEQQTVSIAKAGIITTLNARTSILASANPIGSRYNPNLPVPQNIDLPPTLLSRFDLVYLVLDRVDEVTDRRLAKHLVGMYLEDTPQNASREEILPIDFLTSYISYARTSIHPTLTAPACRALVDAYVTMRSLGSDIRSAERRITATTRQLESMIRLAEAHAKMRLSTTVHESDVREAVRLIKSAVKASATDQRTGLIDLGLLSGGGGVEERRKREGLRREVLRLIEGEEGGGVRVQEVVRRVAEGSSVEVEGGEVVECLRVLESEGLVQVTGEGARRVVRRVLGVV